MITLDRRLVDYRIARDGTMIMVQVLTGLRRAELCRLGGEVLTDRQEDGSSRPSVLVKGGHRRRVYIPPPAMAAIDAWVERWDPRPPLWGGISTSTYGHVVGLYARAAGLRCSTHWLRHSAAKLRREAGASLEEIQAVLGHSNLATTDRYLRRLEPAPDTRWGAVAAAIGVA
ncbi:MAG: hypothetical protein A2Y78_04740 [Acidobacteria bacterium RBG_13_68_16]|nr:MAG: hypothetical protein A2Y78_04740 [Acidobacteria bacterium RBG_13_68_16]